MQTTVFVLGESYAQMDLFIYLFIYLLGLWMALWFKTVVTHSLKLVGDM